MNQKREVSKSFQDAIDLYVKQEYEAAKARLHHVIQFEKGNAEAMHLLGVIYYLVDKNDDAILYIMQAIALDSSNDAFYTNLGNCYQKMRNFEEAEVNFTKAIKLNSANLEARFNLANLKFLMEDLPAAKALYLQVLDLAK